MRSQPHPRATFAILSFLIPFFVFSCKKSEIEDSAPSYTRNTLNWQTATEDQVFGYFVYRGESESGPFRLLNRLPLPGGGTTDEIREYEFTDEEAVPGSTYYYYLETLQFDNRRKRFSPVFAFQTPEA